MDYPIIADLHTHTVASGHAVDTIRTMCAHACRCGLEGIAITDHGPGMPDGSHFIYFSVLHRMTERIDLPVRIIHGAEDDIKSLRGDLHLPQEVRDRLELVIVGLHPNTWIADKSRTARTDAVVHVIERGLAHIIAHPVSTFIDVEVGPVAEAAKACGAALELNTSKLADREAILDLLDVCARKETPIVLNSDAHVAEEVGQFARGIDLLREAGFPHRLLMNGDPGRLASFLGLDWRPKERCGV
jgi:putative hydrolase